MRREHVGHGAKRAARVSPLPTLPPPRLRGPFGPYPYMAHHPPTKESPIGARGTDEERAATLQARRTCERLKCSRASLEAFLFRLESLHADRSGACRFCYPRVPILSDEAIPVYRSIL